MKQLTLILILILIASIAICGEPAPRQVKPASAPGGMCDPAAEFINPYCNSGDGKESEDTTKVALPDDPIPISEAAPEAGNNNNNNANDNVTPEYEWTPLSKVPTEPMVVQTRDGENYYEIAHEMYGDRNLAEYLFKANWKMFKKLKKNGQDIPSILARPLSRHGTWQRKAYRAKLPGEIDILIPSFFKKKNRSLQKWRYYNTLFKWKKAKHWGRDTIGNFFSIVYERDNKKCYDRWPYHHEVYAKKLGLDGAASCHWKYKRRVVIVQPMVNGKCDKSREVRLLCTDTLSYHQYKNTHQVEPSPEPAKKLGMRKSGTIHVCMKTIADFDGTLRYNDHSPKGNFLRRCNWRSPGFEHCAFCKDLDTGKVTRRGIPVPPGFREDIRTSWQLRVAWPRQ